MSNPPRFLRLSLSVWAIFAACACAQGQASVRAHTALTSDWTSQHIVFSRPVTHAQAERAQSDPRYWQQRLQRSLPPREVAAEAAMPGYVLSPIRINKHRLFHGDWSENMGSGATVGATNYPAKYSFSLTSATCAGGPGQPDFAVYATGLAGSGSQASIVAYDNLYSGCTGTVPQVYWSYNTQGTVTTSPVFSGDGTQLAFVQTNGGSGELVLLTWQASTSGTLMPVSPGSYPGCTVPCLTTLPLQIPGAPPTPTADATSSVFYDYSHDIAYVGDESGLLHKFSPVFDGIPAEVTTGGWPVQVSPSPATALTSPVYDSTSGNVFVCDNGGYLYQVNATTGAVVQSGQLDFSVLYDVDGPGITQGPMVDSDAELVYVFATSDGSLSCTGGADCSALYELAVDFAAGDTGSKAEVGNSSIEPASPSPMFVGRFDSTYINSGNATGNFYVCGNTGGSPTLYQVQMVSGSFTNAIQGPALSTGTPPCSPVSDIYNPNTSGAPTEWIFASAENSGAASACSSGGCLYNFVDTPWQPDTTYVAGQQIIDTHFQIQVCITPSPGGKSGTGVPNWVITPGTTESDGSVTWINQGVQSGSTPGSWMSRHRYAQYARILDVHNNIEVATTPGMSGATTPSFNPLGQTTKDGAVTWTNVGQPATNAIASAGGTSGLIMDNTVSTGVQAGASQVYFSTLTNGSCGGGCAVQASQSQLQ